MRTNVTQTNERVNQQVSESSSRQNCRKGIFADPEVVEELERAPDIIRCHF